MFAMKRQALQCGIISLTGKRSMSAGYQAMVHANTVATLRKIRDGPGKKIFYFESESHPACKIITPYIESCALAYPDIKVVLVNFEQHIALAQEHQIRLVPTFMFVDGGNNVVGKFTGCEEDKLRPLVKGFVSS